MHIYILTANTLELNNFVYGINNCLLLTYKIKMVVYKKKNSKKRIDLQK